MDPRTQAHCAVLRLTASLGSRLRPGALEIEFRLYLWAKRGSTDPNTPRNGSGERDGVDPHEDEMARRFNFAMPGSEMRERHRAGTRHDTPSRLNRRYTSSTPSTPPARQSRSFAIAPFFSAFSFSVLSTSHERYVKWHYWVKNEDKATCTPNQSLVSGHLLASNPGSLLGGARGGSEPEPGFEAGHLPAWYFEKPKNYEYYNDIHSKRWCKRRVAWVTWYSQSQSHKLAHCLLHMVIEHLTY